MDLQKGNVQQKMAEAPTQERSAQIVRTRTVNYRGIAGVIRRAINQRKLTDKITALQIQKLMPPEKAMVPSDRIYKTLSYLFKRGELQLIEGYYYPSTYRSPSMKSPVLIRGELLKTENVDGRVVAIVQVDKLEMIQE